MAASNTTHLEENFAKIANELFSLLEMITCHDGKLSAFLFGGFVRDVAVWFTTPGFNLKTELETLPEKQHEEYPMQFKLLWGFLKENRDIDVMTSYDFAKKFFAKYPDKITVQQISPRTDSYYRVRFMQKCKIEIIPNFYMSFDFVYLEISRDKIVYPAHFSDVDDLTCVVDKLEFSFHLRIPESYKLKMLHLDESCERISNTETERTQLEIELLIVQCKLKKCTIKEEMLRTFIRVFNDALFFENSSDDVKPHVKSCRQKTNAYFSRFQNYINRGWMMTIFGTDFKYFYPIDFVSAYKQHVSVLQLSNGELNKRNTDAEILDTIIKKRFVALIMRYMINQHVKTYMLTQFHKTYENELKMWPSTSIKLLDEHSKIVPESGIPSLYIRRIETFIEKYSKSDEFASTHGRCIFTGGKL